MNNEQSLMMNVAPGQIGVAVRSEIAQLMSQAKGNRAKAVELSIDRLCSLEMMSESELEPLRRICKIGYESSTDTIAPESAYAQVRQIHAELLRSKNPSPVAVAFAATAADGYIRVEDSESGEPTVTFAKRGPFQDAGTALGTGIGVAIGGVAGGVIGGMLGGAIGGAVDDCLEDDKKT